MSACGRIEMNSDIRVSGRSEMRSVERTSAWLEHESARLHIAKKASRSIKLIGTSPGGFDSTTTRAATAWRG